MSDESTPQAGSDSPKTDKKPRSSVERVIVWGGIIALLLLVGVQAHARLGYTMTLNRLKPLVDDDFEGAEPLSLADAGSHIVGFPAQSDPTETEREYRWYGIRSYGITLVHSSLTGTSIVTSLVTDDPPVPEEPEQYTGPGTDEDEEELDATMDMPGPGGPGGGGPGGGGGFNPMDNDADGDGKLSPEEVSERMLERFDDNDTDGDGFLDESEIEAMMERFQARRGEREGAGDGEERPQRPTIEGADDDAPEDAENGDDSATDDSAPDEAGDEESTPAESTPGEASDEETADSP